MPYWKWQLTPEQVREICARYAAGESISQIAPDYAGSAAISTVRRAIYLMGIMRPRTQAIRLRLLAGSPLKGRKRKPFSAEHRANLSAARVQSTAATARGYSLKPSGYIEVTMGAHKGRGIHRVIAEQTIGRPAVTIRAFIGAYERKGHQVLNKILIIGNLGKDPEVRFTPNGQAVCKFPVATSEKWKDAGGQMQERVEWHSIVVWGKQAESCGQYLAKGRQVYVEGRIQTRNYDDKDGNKRYVTEIIAANVRFLGGGGQRSEGGIDRYGQSGGGGAESQPEPPGQQIIDDLPF